MGRARPGNFEPAALGLLEREEETPEEADRRREALSTLMRFALHRPESAHGKRSAVRVARRVTDASAGPSDHEPA